MRHAVNLLLLLFLGLGGAAVQHQLTVSGPTPMWAAWAVDEYLGGPGDIDHLHDGDDAYAAAVDRAADRTALAPETIASAASRRLEAFRSAAQAHPLCMPWTCAASGVAVAPLDVEQAAWARDRVLRAHGPKAGRSTEIEQSRRGRNAERAAAAAEAMLRPLNLILGIGMAGVCLSWWRRTAVWPWMALGVTAAAASLAHQAVALAAFDLRHVQLGHLRVGAWVMFAGLLGGLLIGGAAQRTAWVESAAQRWIAFGPGPAAWVRGAVLLLLTAAWTWGPGWVGWKLLPAQQMEGLLAIAAFALATFVARNLAWTEATGQATAFGWPLVALGVLAGSAASLVRGDGGALALTLGLAMTWSMLTFSWRLLAPMLVATTVAWGAWLWSLPPLIDTGASMPSVIETAVDLLPHRIGERVAVAWTPFGAGPSDVARVIGLTDLAGIAGFGFDAPLEGLAAGREADRRLLQLTADYMPAVLVAVYGAAVALALLALHALALLLLAWLGVRHCAGAGVSSAHRLLALWGVFGLFGAVMRVLLSAGGSVGVLPLTGVPAPGLSLGTSAALAVGLMAGLAWSPGFWRVNEERATP
jgi:hypothetical protein